MTLALHGGMVVLEEQPPTAEVQLEPATVFRESLDQFMAFAGNGGGVQCQSPIAPLSFALLLRRGHGPGSSISPRAFAIHGGHDIRGHSPIAVGESYAIAERIERAFAKTGRSGSLAVVERRISIRNSLGLLAVEITDRQIVRWRPDNAKALEQAGTGNFRSFQPAPFGITPVEARAPCLDVGDHMEFRHPGIAAHQISDWANLLRDRESLFHDRAEAHRLGYGDLVVPGPLQSAIVDCWLAQLAPEWRATQLHMTFRQSLLANQALRVDAVVIDAEPKRRVLDILIHSPSGEATAAGTAELQPA